jgi:hypothetical protein
MLSYSFVIFDSSLIVSAIIQLELIPSNQKCINRFIIKNLETKTLKWMQQLTGDYDKEVENSHVIAHFVRCSGLITWHRV